MAFLPKNYEQIKIIDQIFPELVINFIDKEGKYHYYFRCLTSEDDTDGFDTPVQALAHFAKRLSDEQDAMLEDEEEEDNDDDVGYSGTVIGYEPDGHEYELIVPKEA